MAKSDFICKNCKKLVTFGFLQTPVRYRCPEHGIICKDCVDTHFLGRATCKECGSKLIQFKFNGKGWVKV